MTTRRHFIASVALSTMVTAAPMSAYANAFKAPAVGLRVIDPRIADWSRLALLQDTPLVVLDADVSVAWFNTIRPHLEAHRTPIAGLTQEDALFCLQQLAADFRWRLQSCADVTQGQEISATCLTTRSNTISWLLVPPSFA